jgi:protein-tyrosine kinase
MSIVQATLERLRKSQVLAPAPGPRALAQPLERPAPEVNDRSESAAVPWRTHLAAAHCTIEKLAAAGLYPPNEFVQRVREEYRGIRRQVVAASRERVAPAERTVGPLIVVTSAMPGDGKSYTATNLALSLAREGVRDVLLIDADTARRTISKAYGLEDRPGLTELLSQRSADFLDYALLTAIPRLHVLPAGQRSDEDLFSAARVTPLFESLRHSMREHLVVIDTAPILMSNDTAVMADLAGQVLLVVRAGTTLQDSVREAAARVHEGVPIGIVLNDWSPLLPSDRKAYHAYGEYYAK